jgi:NAD(P)H dehydrogenase (quinone)
MAKILVVFSSIFGANAELAGAVESVLQRLGAQVRTRSVREVLLNEGRKTAEWNGARVTADDLAWADGFVVSSPSHTGLPSASIKAFIDEHHAKAIAGAYANKTFTAMATSEFAHAGQERVVEFLNAAAAVWGCVLVPPSTAYSEINKVNGNPYGLSFVLTNGRVADAKATESVLRAHLARFVTITDALAAIRMGRQPAHRAETGTPQRAADVFSTGTGTKTPQRAADVFSTGAGTKTPLRAADVFSS